MKLRRWGLAALIGVGGSLVAGIGTAVACGVTTHGGAEICFGSHNNIDARFGGYVSAYGSAGTVSIPGVVIPIPQPPGPVGPIGDGVRVTANVSATESTIYVGTTTVYSPGGNVSIPGVVIPIPQPPGPVGPIGDVIDELLGGGAEQGPVAGDTGAAVNQVVDMVSVGGRLPATDSRLPL